MAMLPNLDRNSILSVTDSKVEPLEIPEWNGTVYIRTVTGAERDAIEFALEKDPKTGVRRQPQFRAWFAWLTVCDESGKRLFTKQDIPDLAKKNGAAIERIMDAGLILNKIGKEDVEEMVKNSSSIQDGDSGSDLLDTLDAASASANNE